jgi:hypothetical protein
MEANNYQLMVKKILKLSRSDTTEDLDFELEKLSQLQSEINTTLKFGMRDPTNFDYILLVGLSLDFDNRVTYGDDTLDCVKRFKENLKEDLEKYHLSY